MTPSTSLYLIGRWLALLLSLASFVDAQQTTNPLAVCSSDNTGTDETYIQFNSFGSCSQHCSGYAYAIMLGSNCWCSNTTPGDSVSVSQCSDSCPGFPSDRCGNSAEGLYGYAQIGNPSSTAQASSSSTSSSSQDSSSDSSSSATSSTESTTSTSSTSTSTSESSTTSSTSTSTTTSQSSSTDSSRSTSSASSKTTSESPSFVVSYVTVTGQVRTITAGTSPTASADSAAVSSSATGAAATANKNNSDQKGFWHNKGAVGGTFAAVGIVIAAILALLLFLFCRRRHEEQEEVIHDQDSNATKNAMSQHPTTESSPHSQKHFRDSMVFEDQETQLVPIFDQRVDPTQMYMRWDNTASQQSLQDNQDYSRRVLRVVNPEES